MENRVVYKKALIFAKYHWKIPAIVALLLVSCFLYRSKVSSLLSLLSNTREDYKEALGESQKTNSKHIQDVATTALAGLEKQESRQKKLDTDLKNIEEEKENLEQELQEDLDEIARKIKERF